jgi:hypothetical protein
MGQTFTPSLRKAKLALVRALIEPERLIPAGTVDVCDEKSIELALGPAKDVCADECTRSDPALGTRSWGKPPQKHYRARARWSELRKEIRHD